MAHENTTEVNLGMRVRALRTQRGLSLRALAEQCGLSFNAISRIERGESSPTVATLQRLAQALSVPVTAFFGDDGRQMAVYVKSDERLRTTTEGMLIEDLASGLPQQQIEPFRVVVAPGAGDISTPITHPGEEFVHCLAGELEYRVGETIYRLQPGDSLLFKAEQPHSWCNPGTEPAEVLIIFEALQVRHPLWQRHLG